MKAEFLSRSLLSKKPPLTQGTAVRNENVNKEINSLQAFVRVMVNC